MSETLPLGLDDVPEITACFIQSMSNKEDCVSIGDSTTRKLSSYAQKTYNNKKLSELAAELIVQKPPAEKSYTLGTKLGH